MDNLDDYDYNYESQEGAKLFTLHFEKEVCSAGGWVGGTTYLRWDCL